MIKKVSREYILLWISASFRQKKISKRNVRVHVFTIKCPRNNRMPLRICSRRGENSTFSWIFRYSFHSSHSTHSKSKSNSTIPLLLLFPSISDALTRDCFRIRFSRPSSLFFSFLSLSLSLELSFPRTEEKNLIRNKTPDVTGYIERSNKGDQRIRPDHSPPSSTV